MLAITYQNCPSHPMRIRMVLCHRKAGGKTAGVTFNQVDELRRAETALIESLYNLIEYPENYGFTVNERTTK